MQTEQELFKIENQTSVLGQNVKRTRERCKPANSKTVKRLMRN
jgi:hypothetical protein